MPLLSIDRISMSFGDRNLLNDISFQVNEGDKIAFVGSNGSGKTTLYRLIKGELTPDSGEVIKHGNVILGYLSQNMKDQDISSYTLKPSEMIAIEDKIEDILSKLTLGESEELLKEYDKASIEYEAMGGFTYDHKIKEALAGLGLKGIDTREDINTLSGGELMRVCLARLMVSRPDILILDEPTNHLDVDAIEFLESFLSSYGGAVFVISHDRSFINNVANRVIELEDAGIREYRGNYDDFKLQKEEFIKYEKARILNITKELEHQLDVKQTMLSHRNISGYHQREKMVAKLEEVLRNEKSKLSSGRGAMSFSLNSKERTGAKDKLLMDIREVSKGFPDKEVLFTNISFELKAGEKLFLCGPNGCGKSTLLNILIGKTSGDSGKITIADGITMGYMGQFVPFDNEELTIYEELISRADIEVTEARTLLARFGFTGDDVYKTINVLSGGERSRLYLCCLLMEKPDILFLDEPTNHLDIDSREILEAALTDYNGAIVAVSHDRFFIDRCAHKILGFIGDSASLFDKYAYYRREYLSFGSKALEPEIKPSKKNAKNMIKEDNRAEARKENAKKRTRIKTIEGMIFKLEAEQKELEEGFCEGASKEEYEKYASNASFIEELYEEYYLLSEELGYL